MAALSVAVVLGVAWVIYAAPAQSAEGSFAQLPTLIAVFNAGAAAFLTLGYVFIRRRNVLAHRRCMLSAVALSGAFLIAYLVHHAQVGSVPFGGQGALRVVYFAVLIPHIVLAAAIVPLVLLTLWRALTDRFVHHRRIARVTLPLWLFVSVSGVVIYVLLYHVPP